MQTERIPKQNPPPPRLTLVTADSDAHSLQARKRRSNRLLAWSVLASLSVNALVVVLLGHADLFGQARTVEAVRRIRVQVYKPSVRKPPKTEMKIKAAVTPPARTPRIRRIAARPAPLLRLRPTLQTQTLEPPYRIQPMKPTPQAAAPRPAMPTAPHVSPPVPHMARASGPRPFSAPPPRLLPGKTTPPTIPAAPFASATPPISLPRHEDPLPAPVRHAAPPPLPLPRHEDPPPAPVRHAEPKRPANWVDVEVQAAAVSSVPDPDTSGVDPADVKGPCVVAFEIGENGRVSSVRIRKSSGSADFDRACQDAIRRARCVPAVQDHIPQVQKMTYSFSS